MQECPQCYHHEVRPPLDNRPASTRRSHVPAARPSLCAPLQLLKMFLNFDNVKQSEKHTFLFKIECLYVGFMAACIPCGSHSVLQCLFVAQQQ